jgi:hypothetical protein
MTKLGTLGHVHPAVVILLIVVTGGLYIPVWYIRRRSLLSSLKTPSVPPRYLPYGLLCLNVLVLAMSLTLEDSASLALNDGGWTQYLRSLVAGLYMLLNIFLAIRVVDILYEYSNDRLTSNYTVSRVRAALLSIVYLQYEMNRLPVPIDSPR